VSGLEGALREAIAGAEFGGLVDFYGPGSNLDASIHGGRTRRRGAEEICAELARLYPHPGRILEWDANETADGVAVWLERLDEAGEGVRQRHYLRREGGVVGRHCVFAAPPRHPEIVAPGSREPAAPAELFEGLGRVREQAVLDSTGWSGSRLESAVLEGGRRLILKRIVPGGDWLARISRDRGREGLLFDRGTMARFPAGLDSAIRAAVLDEGAWWLAMDDVSEYLLGTSGPISRDLNREILGAVATVWERFWGEEVPAASTFLDRQQIFNPSITEDERDGLDLLPKQMATGWDAFGEAVPAEVSGPVLSIVADPSEFIAAFAECGTTLVHGDLRDEQLGIDGDRVIAIDWGLASNAHPAYELAWYMMHCGWRIEAGHEEILADYRAAVGERDDPRALELGIISGLAQYGWILGLCALIHPDPVEYGWARSELEWWVPRVRRALEETGIS